MYFFGSINLVALIMCFSLIPKELNIVATTNEVNEYIKEIEIELT
jgi:hypothetical protein